MRTIEDSPRAKHLLHRLEKHTKKQYPTSVVILNHGNLGFSAALRYDDSSLDENYSAHSKEEIYRKIEFLFKPQRYRSWA